MAKREQGCMTLITSRCVYASTRLPRRSTTDAGACSTSCCVNSRRRNLTATWATSSSPGQVRLTLEYLAKRRSLVGVQVRVGMGVGDASSAGVIVVRRRELEIALSGGRDQLLHRARWARDTPAAPRQEQGTRDECNHRQNRPRRQTTSWLTTHRLTFPRRSCAQVPVFSSHWARSMVAARLKKLFARARCAHPLTAPLPYDSTVVTAFTASLTLS